MEGHGEIQGLAFTVRALTSFAVLCIMFGVALIVIEMGNRLDENFHANSKFGNWMRSKWELLAACSWREVPDLVIRNFVTGICKSIDYWFGQSEKNVLTSGLFLFVVLVAIPIAALLNYLRGGSGFLLSVLVVSFAIYVCLLIFGEIRRLSLLAALFSAYLFCVVFFFVPGYVFVSFTDLILHMPTGHAAIGGVLVAPILYLLCHSLALAANSLLSLNNASTLQRGCRIFAASLPVAYLLIFAAFLYGHLAAAQQPSIQNWQLLLSSLFFTGLSITITISIFVPSKKEKSSSVGKLAAGYLGSFLIAALLSLLMIYLGLPNMFEVEAAEKLLNVMVGMSPAGDAGLLGPVFWIMHIPFVPLGLVTVVVVLGMLSKLLITIDAGFPSTIGFQKYPLAGGGAVFITGGAAAMAMLLT